LGLKKPVHILQLGTSVRNIVNMATIAVVDAQLKGKSATEEMVKRSPWWKRIKTKEPTNQ
jgi:malate dehydrogenase (oxaloacetate-decarboxylating)(NADP+)